MDKKLEKIQQIIASKQPPKQKNLTQDYYLFKDKLGSLQVANVNYVPKNYIHINCSSATGEESGYVRIYNSDEERMFLDVITVYTQYRGNGVASTLSDIADIYMAREDNKKLVYGVFNPTQLGNDRFNGVTEDETKLNLQAENFYQKNGYTIITPEEKLPYSEQDPLLEQIEYFTEDSNDTLVVKHIPENPINNFVMANGIFYQKELYEELFPQPEPEQQE